MKKPFKILISILSCVSGVLSIAISSIAIQRWCLEYNNEGRFFDPTEAVVYDIDGRLFYTLFSITFWLMTFLLSFILYRTKRN